MFQPVTKKDIKDAAAIERRKRFEEDRKQRIFNAKTRTIGIDCDGIEEQRACKAKQQQDEADRQKKLDEEQKRQSETLRQKELELHNERRRIHAELNEFRAFYQKPEQRREFDINNPDQLRNEQPPRVADEDPKVTLSGGQVFLGEDLESKKRRKAQNDQQRSWLLQQMAERKKLVEMEREIDQMHLKALQENDQKALKFESSERLRRQHLHAGNVEYNLAMAAEQRANRHRQKMEEQNDNRAEITNHLTSDMLTENPEVANSALGPHRKIAYQYKGMSDEEIAAVRAQQQQQQDDMRRQRSGEQIALEKWEKLEQQQARSVHLKERELGRQMRNLTLNLVEENTQLAGEQKRQADYKDNVLYTNVPTTEYFAQFNTVTR